MHRLNQQVSEALSTRRPVLAAQMVALDFVRHPELEQRYGVAGRDRCLEDAGYHLAYLAQAIAADSVALFVDYVGWAKVTLAKRDFPARDLGGLLEIMKESLQQELPPEFSRLAGHFLDHGLQRLPQLADDVPSFIVEGAPLAPLARAYLQALLRGEREIASQLILDAARQGTAVRDLYLRVFQCTQYEIGRLWQVNEISVAQEHYCTAATQLIMSQLHPYIFGGEKTRGALVATCVSGDLHEIGVRMVSDLFEMDGWHTYYLGANTPVPAVVQALVQRQADALAISATITYHVRGIESLIAAVRRTPDCGRVKILVGGYPFKIDPDLWRKIGADGSAPDAEGAIRLANRLMNEVPPRMKVEPARPEIVPPAAAREPAPTGRVPTRLDDHLYEELSRINNELANHQRELARTNAEMAATQKKLAISEQRFRNLSACLPIGILELDAAGRCIYTNSHWQTISGLTAEESLGDGWQRALDPRDAPAFLEERTQARQTGREFSREVRFVNTRGDERWAQVRSRAIPAGDGQAASRVSTVEDITERKRAEAALCASESKLRKLWPAVEQNPASVVITDRQGLIEYVNPKFCASSGYSFGEVLGKNPRMLSSGEMPVASYRQLWKTITAGGTWSGEFHNRKKNGELYWESASISPIYDGQGNITHFLAVKEDITGRKRTEELLRRSEEKFRGFVENLRDAVMTLDPSTHQFSSANPAAIKMFDAKNEEELLSFTPGSLSPERQPDGSLSEEKARRCTEALDEAPQRFEWVHQRISGAVFFTEVMLTRMEHGSKSVVLATIRDITERKQAENTLRESEERFSGAFLQAPIGVVLVAPEGHFLKVNRAFCQITGYTEIELLSCTFQSITHPEDLADALEQVRQVLAGQISTYQMEKRCVHKDGHPVTILLHVSLVRDKQNQPGYFIAQAQDITQQKRAEELQKKLALELQHAQKLESIGTLAAGVAHEINTPAQYIEHNLRFLQENFPKVRQLLDFYQDLSREAQAGGNARENLVKAGGEADWSAQRALVEEIPEAIEDALEGIGRVITIVRAMKDFAHPGVGATESPVEINLNRAIESTIIVARNEWRYVADVVMEFDPKLPSVRVQPGSFNQVVLNVLVNAAQAIEEATKKNGREKGTITISTHQDGDWVEVRIRDTGPGIPENIRHRIFEPFFTTKPIGQGTGQGLAISRSVIVEKHHGEFTFETETDKGTCFKIRLPAKPSRSVGDFTPASPEHQDPK